MCRPSLDVTPTSTQAAGESAIAGWPSPRPETIEVCSRVIPWPIGGGSPPRDNQRAGDPGVLLYLRPRIGRARRSRAERHGADRHLSRSTSRIRMALPPAASAPAPDRQTSWSSAASEEPDYKPLSVSWTTSGIGAPRPHKSLRSRRGLRGSATTRSLGSPAAGSTWILFAPAFHSSSSATFDFLKRSPSFRAARGSGARWSAGPYGPRTRACPLAAIPQPRTAGLSLTAQQPAKQRGCAPRSRRWPRPGVTQLTATPTRPRQVLALPPRRCCGDCACGTQH